MLVTTQNLSKYFGSTCILEDVNVYIGEDSRIGLIGENGAGKSTFLGIISGDIDYDDGTIERGNNTRIGYLKQNSGLNFKNTIWEEMVSVFEPLLETEKKLTELQQKMSSLTPESEELKKLTEEYNVLFADFEHKGGYNYEFRIKTILNGMGFLDFDKTSLTANLSGGEKTRLALAKLLLWEPSLLILDEPTNHLDFKTLMWLEEYLNKEYKGAVLIVSHDRYFLDKTVTEIWEIEDTHLDSYKGNYSKFSVLKKEKIKALEKEYEIQERKIASLEDYVARNLVRASTTKMAQSRRTQLEKMERIDKPKTAKKRPFIRFPFDRQPVKDVFHAENINLFYEDNGDKNYISQNIVLDVLKGEKVAIIGDNGIGKSTLLKAILKNIPCEYDKIVWGANTKVSYYDQEGKQLHSTKQVINELWDRFPKMYEQEVRTHLGSMLFTGEEVYKQVSSLSGGEKARLALSILSLEKPNVLVMDEPTNHIDIETKEALEEALINYEGTIILVSHDRYLLNKLPTKIYEITKNGGVLYNGNFDFYLKNKVVETEEKPVEEKKPSENAVKHYRSKQDRAKLVSNKKRAEKIENTMAENEEKIAELEKLMVTQEVTSDYQRLNDICEEITSLKKENDNLSDEWLLVCEEIELLSGN